MLELPEAVAIADQITQTIQGKRVARAIANQSPHKFAWYTGDPADYHERLAGKVVGRATAHAGVVEIQVEDKTLLLSTSMRYYAAGAKRPPKHQLLLEFDDGSALVATVQMWGCLFCIGEGEQAGFADYESSKGRPSPLTEAFDRPYFDSLFDENTGKLSAKAFLATEQRIPGLGNGVLQDILWTARIHPKRKMADLSSEEIGTMYAAVKSVLRAMAEQGGRDTEKDLFGQPGGYVTVLSRNTVDMPCPVCGQDIRKEAYLGGAIYYCPGCQQL